MDIGARSLVARQPPPRKTPVEKPVPFAAPSFSLGGRSGRRSQFAGDPDRRKGSADGSRRHSQLTCKGSSNRDRPSTGDSPRRRSWSPAGRAGCCGHSALRHSWNWPCRAGVAPTSSASPPTGRSSSSRSNRRSPTSVPIRNGRTTGRIATGSISPFPIGFRWRSCRAMPG